MQSKTCLSAKRELVDAPTGTSKFSAKCREVVLAGLAKNPGQAILVAARLEPELFNQWERDGRPE